MKSAMRIMKNNINILISMVVVIFSLQGASAQCDYTMEVPGVLDPQSLYHRRVLRGNANLLQHYWQTSATGVARGEANHAVHFHTVYEAGSYYVRRYSETENCWSQASTPVQVTINYTPPLAVVSQAQMQGYSIVAFTPEDKGIILQYADYYWVSNASPSATIVSAFTNNGHEVNNHINKTGTYYVRGRDRATQTWGPTLTVVVEISDDDKMNWVHTTYFKNRSRSIFDPEDPVIGESRSYFDSKGQKVQDQTRVISSNRIMAVQPLVDRRNRMVGASLPAPISGSDFRFVENLMADESGEPYDGVDFDVTGADNPEENTLYNPASVGNALEGTVGWYYSANNTSEPYVPKTGFPYSRAEFYDDGSGLVRRSAAPGNEHRLGKGHEVLSCTFRVSNELDDYLKKRTIVFPNLSQPATLKDNAWQSGVRDENGKYAVTLSDKAGRVVMTGRFGGTQAGQYTLETVNKMMTSSANVQSAPARQYFYLTHPQQLSVVSTGGGACAVTNLETGVKNINPQTELPAGFYLLEPGGPGGQVEVTYKSHFADVTYNFYDDAGRLCTSVSPNGTKVWAGFESPTSIHPPAASPGIAEQTQLYPSLDKTTYKYNFKGWLLELREPDAGITRYKYRTDGKILFSQNALQRENESTGTPGKGRFSYTLYDALHRPVEFGEYTNDQDQNTDAQYKFDQLTEPVSIAGADRVDWVKTTYDARQPNEAIPYLPETFVQDFTEGRVAVSENPNTKTWYSYNDRGLMKWMAQKPEGVARTFLLEYTYDFAGNVLTVISSSYDSEGARLDVFYHHFEYDADSRLYKSYTSLDGSKKKLRATYFYYLHGPLKRIELGEKLQGIDFVYNINGWLIKINHPDKSKDPGGDTNDVFGMVLDYYESDMNDIFSLGATRNQVDPRRFHKLPGTEEEEPEPDVAYKPRPAYRQEMLCNIDRMKVLLQEQGAPKHVPVTLADFRDVVSNDDATESQHADEELVALDVHDEQALAQAVASSKPVLYDDAGVVDAVPDAIEFAALKAIFDNMGGTGWINKTNWPTVWPASATAAQFGTWYGVTVSGGDVTMLNLSNNQLTGALVSEIGTLTQLVTLQLNANAITSIPPEIGQLTKVVTLYLFTNRLTAIPPAITGMSALKNLRLQANQITGNIPSFLGSISTLTQLYLGNNLFTGGIPASFNGLVNLTLLDVSSNSLTGPIADLSALQYSLTTFNAEHNAITGSIPAHLGNLHALVTLELSSNAFNGPIPPELNDLTNLTRLELAVNGLTGEIPDLSRLKKLRSLSLQSNQLENIPATLGELTELRSLTLQGNRLRGSIPRELGKLVNLITLYLNTNQLTGELPQSLGELKALQGLNLAVNQLSGPLPPSWKNMTELTSLNLSTNKLTGSIPAEWSSMTKLLTLYLNKNQLEGGATTSLFSSMPLLREIRLQDNKLSGELPADVFTGLTGLRSLYLHNNALSGPFPSSIGACQLLTYISSTNNSFTELPSSLLTIPGLTNVGFQNNRLEAIPDFSTYSNKANLTIYLKENLLDFTMWEPIFGAAGAQGIKLLDYNQQASFTDPARVSATAGTSLVITARPKGQYTTVIWEKKSGATWVNVNAGNEDATQQTFRISTPQAANEGTYRWTETDTKVPSLVLRSGEIQVKLGDALPDPLSTQTALYNGLINAVYWRTDKAFGTEEDEYTGVYRFEYDDKYQVKESRWGNPDATWTTFTDAGNKYRLVGMEYDPNGNIQRLRRYAEDGFIKNDFTYHYDATVSKNRLTSVDNYASAYSYDALGRITSEKKVEDADHYIEYDVTGKVRKVFFDERKTVPNVEYRYDDRGFRLAKVDYQAKVTTWYIRDAAGNITSIYEQKGDLPDPLRQVVWSSFSNTAYANGMLSVSPGFTTGSALASDTVHAGQSAYIEYTASEVLKGKTFGFSRVSGAVRFTFGFAATTGTFVITRAGAGQNFPGSNAYAIGDKFKIERMGDKIHFYHIAGQTIRHLLELPVAETDEFVVFGSLTAAASTLKSSDLVYKTEAPSSAGTTLTLKEIPVYGAGKLGTYYPKEEGSVVYEITDHLGNVRALLRDHVNVYRATMEDSGEPDTSNPRVEEMRYFDNLFETEWTDARMNHTPADVTPVETPANAAFLYWRDGGGAYPLGDVDERSIGPAIGLKVKPGDIVDLETWVRYERKMLDNEEQPYSTGLTLATLSQTLGSSLAYKAGFESLTAMQATTALNTALTLAGFLGAGESQEQDMPFAYLNYMLFDADNQLIDAGWQRITTTAGFLPSQENPAVRPHERLKFDEPIQVTQPGSIYVWVSNESEDVKVWFDDLKVEHSTSLVVQATDYGIWGELLREQRSEDRDYRYGYQGQFAERDEQTGWNHFELREYDPVIGRWMVVDPRRQHWSPYLAMRNNPVSSLDPTGGETPEVGTIMFGYMWNGTAWTNSYSQDQIVVVGKKWTNEDESSFQAFEKVMNAFGAWLEETINLPRGEGMVFFSGQDENRVLFGDLYHVRDGHATHEIDNPTSMLKTLQGSGGLFKDVTKSNAKKLGTVLDFMVNSKDMLEAYDLFDKTPGSKQTLNLITDIVHERIFHFKENEVLGKSVMGVPGEEDSRVIETTTFRDGSMKTEIVERSIHDY